MSQEVPSSCIFLDHRCRIAISQSFIWKVITIHEKLVLYDIGRIYEGAKILIFAIINNHINRSQSPTKMPEEQIRQISNRAFNQDNGTEAFIICNHLRTSPDKMEVSQSTINLDHLLNPPSIFRQDRQADMLDRYLKIKMFEKPKDTLAQIMSRKQQFQSYIRIESSFNERINNQAELDELGRQGRDQLRQTYEHTFAKDVESETIIVVKITPSIRCKCNIVVFNLRGEIVKYYRNCLLIKKGGKILKIFKQFQKQFLVIFDYCSQEFDHKYFIPFLKENFCFCYNFALVPDLTHFIQTEFEEIEHKYTVKLIKLEKKIVVLRLQPNYQLSQEMLKQIQNHFIQKQKQQQQFLLKIRGQRNEETRDFSLDMMAVNIWRQSAEKSYIIGNKINQLFDMKSQKISKMIPQQKQGDVHLPFRMEKEQNCVQCLSINLNKIKPKRTCWSCKVCSAEMQRPIYLCKRKCFGEYHRSTNICYFRKNQKKTKKVLKNKRKLKAQKQGHLNNSKQFNPEREQEHQKIEDNQKEMLCNKLNQIQGQFFDKISAIIQEGQEKNVKSCQFYLNMLLNINIKCLKKITDQDQQTKNSL